MRPCTCTSYEVAPDDVSARAQAQKIACGPLRTYCCTVLLYCTESMKRRADDGRTIHIYIHIYIYHILRALLYRLCGARSGSPQLVVMYTCQGQRKHFARGPASS